jgi:2-phospho-L-lactate guanylyltransferase (CobY/MobA/RfbA family)
MKRQTDRGCLPVAYATWAQAQARVASELEGARRREIAQKCLTDIETARRRIASGIVRLKADGTSREAFAIMNRATTFSEGAA